MTPAPKYRRAGVEPWIGAAYALLAETGHGGLTIEKLTAQTGKTRGSFYYHFGSHDGFILRFLDDWREHNTERVERIVAADPDPVERRAILNREAFRLDTRIETAIRRWAGANQAVAEACREVDRRRLGLIERDLIALAESKGAVLGAKQAKALALIDYATFLGAQMLAPDGSLDAMTDALEVIEEMLDLYLRQLKRVSA